MAVMQNSITFGGVSSASYGIYIGGEGVFNAPARDVEMISIPGRDGALAIDNGRFENISVTYTVINFESDLATFAQNLAAFRNALCSQKGYQRLTDTFHTDEYRMAAFIGGFEVKPIEYNTAAEFEITFDCKPQRFLTSGETVTTMTGSGSITNPTQFESKPLLVVTGTGTLTVNGTSITFSASPTTVDCESMEAYNGTTSRNGSITLGNGTFPVLSPGSNSISKTSGISQVKITPRWWRV